MSPSTPTKIVLAASVALFMMGLGGALVSAWGYGFFLLATALIFMGVLVLAAFLFSSRYDGDILLGVCAWLFRSGGWAYLLACAAFVGFFANETLHGRMEMRWVLFGLAAMAALIMLDWGLYRALIYRNMPTWKRYGHFVVRKDIDAEALCRTLIDEVVLHRTLFSISGIRWLRHALIFWGFAGMFALEIIAVFLREAIPAFGWRDIWQEPGHPVRLAFDAGFDLTGSMILSGCLLALGWRVAVNNTPDRKYADTPTTVFLLLVVLTGFAVEGVRLAAQPPGHGEAASFVGVLFAKIFSGEPAGNATSHETLWLIHVLASCAFIAYVPAMRLIHSCATPMGRLMNSQKSLLAAKRRVSLQGILSGAPFITPSAVHPAKTEQGAGQGSL